MGQCRHGWTTLKSSSDYKATFDQYLAVQPEYLRVERDFLREVDVLCHIPEGYDSGESEEVWDDESPTEILDERRIANFDEVPFTIDWSDNQLVARGERIALTNNAMSRLKKYREGLVHGTHLNRT